MPMKNKVKIKGGIQGKWLGFIVLLLSLNMIAIGYFMLIGVQKNQQVQNESELLETSKAANLYLREKFASSGENDFKSYFEKESDVLAGEMARMAQMPVTLYALNGKVLSTSHDLGSKTNNPLLNKALNNTIIYEKQKKQIVYLAPLYDFESQIGVIELVYSTTMDDALYQSIKLLFYKVGAGSILLTLLIGTLYFSQIAKRIMFFKKAVESVEGNQPVSIQKTNVFDELDGLQNGICDMTERIQQTVGALQNEKNKLEQLVVKLEKLEKEQKTFIGNITHEFKTPITVIKTQMDLMYLYGDDQVQSALSKEVAEKEIMRLTQMIERILDLSRVEKYEFEIKQVPVNTKELLQDICNRMTGKARKYAIEIFENLEEATITTDHESFVQVFINLLDNAIKYNHASGKIDLTSKVSNGELIIDVIDTGIGIPREHQIRIFEPFYIVDQNRSKQYSGTGLGLSLVVKLLEKNKATIQLIPQEQGACFRVIYPMPHSGGK